jgi:hypothetical protein
VFVLTFLKEIVKKELNAAAMLSHPIRLALKILRT